VEDGMACAEQQPIDCVDTHKSSPRRRWLRIGIVAVVALGLLLALVHYRLSRLNELNEVEKRILGEWTTYPDLAGRPITYHIRLNPDRSYSLWSVEGEIQRGNWNASADQLTLSISVESTLPNAYLRSIEYPLDRILRPQNFAPISSHLAVEELSESSIRLHTAEGAKVVYHRAVPAAN
jgi:hypothetical protein